MSNIFRKKKKSNHIFLKLLLLSLVTTGGYLYANGDLTSLSSGAKVGVTKEIPITLN
ncbi:hypothetical protein I3271_07440 [Photobacterium leiognathi]|uniref:hypothetical protein n=1 Tax=Photobacterium leiognathi TaxID=553611 RepID=UPI001EDE6062|nr:hypothetical protein [Photobacterium leiognathi]MCG3884519.1 hypothetical protein [Photobacterium leiognathi]